MTVDEIRAAIQAKGWTYRPKLRRGKEYIYVVHRTGKKTEEKYLGAADRPDMMHLVELLPNNATDVAQQQEDDQPESDQAECIEPTSTPNDPAQPSTPTPAIPGDDDPTSWTYYSRADLRNHDAKRRTWLKEWAKARNYQEMWFTMHGQRSGHYQTKILPGETAWTGFLENGTYYDVYCLFVAAYTPNRLEQYLQDAATRGEIKLGDTLLWRPRDQRKTR